ncbi:hypothetical protein ACLB2K_034657 [Fragaria x ananassa]
MQIGKYSPNLKSSDNGEMWALLVLLVFFKESAFQCGKERKEEKKKPIQDKLAYTETNIGIFILVSLLGEWRTKWGCSGALTLRTNILLASWKSLPPYINGDNTDASVVNNGVNIGVGVVVRNHLGDLVLAGGERVQGRFRPSVAELLALCKGLEYVVEHNWLLEKVECDCLEAVRVVNEAGECFAEEGILVDRVRVLLAAVGSPKLSHVSRTANGAADVVAKYVARLNGRDRPVTVPGSREMSGESFSSTDNSHVL